MRIRVNGDWAEHEDGLNVAGLLAAMSLEPLRVAVERNQQLVRRAEHAETQLADGDELEIVTLVGGG
jgi:thiamine biosynthesis protein ThiS